ncbi:MAG: hypothetical protein ABR614_07400 [Mycobacteriales bacterium]
MAEQPFAPEEPTPWWYTRRARRTLIIGLGVVVLSVLRLLGEGFSVIAALLGLLGLFQVVSGVLSIRRDAHRVT